MEEYETRHRSSRGRHRSDVSESGFGELRRGSGGIAGASSRRPQRTLALFRACGVLGDRCRPGLPTRPEQGCGRRRQAHLRETRADRYPRNAWFVAA